MRQNAPFFLTPTTAFRKLTVLTATKYL